jgi:hypothetical protein
VEAAHEIAKAISAMELAGFDLIFPDYLQASLIL